MANCQFCGKPSKFYQFCIACNKLKEENKIIFCKECNTWHLTDKPCKCEKKTITLNTEKPLSECIICKSNAGGFLFCKECYYKYKNKTVLLKISKCTEIELMDEAYEGKYICADGHIVKSKSERDIDNYLYYNRIRHAYEKAFPIDEDREHDLHPDFYLPEYQGEEIWIEHWGYDESNKQYIEQKEYKLKEYKKAGITLICTDEKKDIADINAALDRKLKMFKKGEINL